MQILTSGSFINLDNGEKIEQLVFTAKAIADSAVQTEGFASSEENNKRLALEIWQGAEYMTREHEQARIQNLFISNFLERLREITPAPSANDSLVNLESASPENSPVESNAAKDEFLGFVNGTAENETQEIAAKDNDVITEKAAADSVEVLPPSDFTAAANVQDENPERETAESLESLTSETIEAQKDEPESDKKIEAMQETETSAIKVSQTVKTENSAVRKITLPEKEPYRWDDCTVTATIQLLPVEAGSRRAVLSVRTHDFAPQISVVELSGAAATPENFMPSLEKAFEKYKTDLPVKVMDKMKREKSAGKKQQPKPPVESKSSSTTASSSSQKPARAETNTVQASVPKAETNQTAPFATPQTVPAQTLSTVNGSKSSVKTSKPENSAQGNLFGF